MQNFNLKFKIIVLFSLITIVFISSVFLGYKTKNRQIVENRAENLTSVCSSEVENSCEFYQQCVEGACIRKENWASELTPIQILAIYNRLKMDLGIDVPLLLDKERVSKLQDLGINFQFIN